MKRKRLTLEESRRLVWLTWFGFMVAGAIVYFFTDPFKIPALLAVPVALSALIYFYVKSEWVPVRLYSVVPTVFMPMAFLSGIAALVSALVGYRIMNSWTLGFATMCVLCAVAAYPESKYADYD